MKHVGAAVFLLLLTSLNNLFAQGYLKITMQHPSSVNASDGAVSYDMVGITQPVQYQTYKLASADSFIATGSSVSNLDTGNYLVLGAIGNHSISVGAQMQNPHTAMSGYFDLDDIVGEFTLGSLYIDPIDTTTVLILDSMSGSNNFASCFGNIFVKETRDMDCFNGFLPGPNDTGTGYLDGFKLVTAGNSQQVEIDSVWYISFSNICAGRNAICFFENGPLVFAGLTFFTGDPNTSFPGVFCTAGSTPVTTTGQCNGSITVNVYGGTPPYTWYVDSVPQSINIFSNVCQGFHEYFVRDSIGRTTLAQDIVVGCLQSTFVSPDSFPGPVVDSIYVNSQNCDYNYNEQTDSAFLDSLVSLAPPEQYIAYFHVWQQGQLIDVIDTLVFDTTGVNMVTMSMYCDTTHRAIEGTVTVVCYVDKGSTHPTEVLQINNDAYQFKISPNPAIDIATVYVQSPVIKNFDLTLTDLSGQVLQLLKGVTDSEVELNLTKLAAGVYVVTLRSNEVNQSRQLVKF